MDQFDEKAKKIARVYFPDGVVHYGNEQTGVAREHLANAIAQALRDAAGPDGEKVKALVEAAKVYQRCMSEVDPFGISGSTSCPIHGVPPAIQRDQYCSRCWSEHYDAQRTLIEFALAALTPKESVANDD